MKKIGRCHRCHRHRFFSKSSLVVAHPLKKITPLSQPSYAVRLNHWRPHQPTKRHPSAEAPYFPITHPYFRITQPYWTISVLSPNTKHLYCYDSKGTLVHIKASFLPFCVGVKVFFMVKVNVMVKLFANSTSYCVRTQNGKGLFLFFRMHFFETTFVGFTFIHLICNCIMHFGLDY